MDSYCYSVFIHLFILFAHLFRSFLALYCIVMSITNLVAADADGSNLEQSLKEFVHFICSIILCLEIHEKCPLTGLCILTDF